MLTHGVMTQQTPGLTLLSGPLSSITTFSPAWYWTLEADSTDYGSVGTPLDVLNGVTTPESAPFAEVTYFDDTTDNRRTSSALTNLSTSWTVGCWFRILAYTDTNMIVSEHGGNASAFSTREFAINLVRNAGGDGYYVDLLYFGGGSAYHAVDSSGDYDVTDSDWHHVACHRSSGKHRIWLDGQLIVTSDAAPATVNNSSDFYMIGQARGGSGSEGLELAHYFHEYGQLTDANIASIANDPVVGLTYPTWP